MFDIPKSVLEDMTLDQVRSLYSEVMGELDALAKWNSRRSEPPLRPGFFAGVPFPEPQQYAWNIKTKR